MNEENIKFISYLHKSEIVDQILTDFGYINNDELINLYKNDQVYVKCFNDMILANKIIFSSRGYFWFYCNDCFNRKHFSGYSTKFEFQMEVKDVFNDVNNSFKLARKISLLW